jgi:hypothetical protein
VEFKRVIINTKDKKLREHKNSLKKLNKAIPLASSSYFLAKKE